MSFKRLIQLYTSHCGNTIFKLTRCKRELDNLECSLLAMQEQSQYIQQHINSLWPDIFGMTVRQKDIYALKRKEALLESRKNDLQLRMKEIQESVDQVVEEIDKFAKLRTYYERKKKKWEEIFNNEQKKYLKKDILRDELMTEECVNWLR